MMVCVLCGMPSAGQILGIGTLCGNHFQIMAQNQVNALQHQNALFGAQTVSSLSSLGVGFGASIAPMLSHYAAIPQKPLEKGTKVEDLIGWRIWKTNGGYLHSFSADALWAPDTPMTGQPNDHDGAGVWAFKDRGKAIKKATESGNGYAVGSVRLWGHVIEHTDGFRAENARVLTIDDVVTSRGTDWQMLALIRERYILPGLEDAQKKAGSTHSLRTDGHVQQEDWRVHIANVFAARDAADPLRWPRRLMLATAAINIAFTVNNLIIWLK